MPKLNDARWVKLSVDKLVAADWNYKVEDPDQEEKLIANIKRNGQVENILVRELESGFYEVINGNHRLDAFKKLGIPTAICYNFGETSDAQARRIAVETNEPKFRRDDAKLAVLIKEMMDGPGSEFTLEDLSTTMPFDRTALEGLVTIPGFDLDKFKKSNDKELANLAKKKEKKTPGVSITVHATCPDCGRKFKVSGKKK